MLAKKLFFSILVVFVLLVFGLVVAVVYKHNLNKPNEERRE
jgi:hypothetical protein